MGNYLHRRSCLRGERGPITDLPKTSLIVLSSSSSGRVKRQSAIGAADVADQEVAHVRLTPETQLGPYKIESAIGAGGTGEVYRALDTRLHRRVAIKMLSAPIASDPVHRERFEREARAIAALNHDD